MSGRALVLALFLLGAGAIGYFAGTRAAPEPASDAGVTLSSRSSAGVVVALRELARLEGAVFHLEKVVDLRQKQSRLFGWVQAEDAILLVAAGDVTAGIDLAQLGPDDLRMSADGASVKVVLPPAEVFSSRVDNERTYVHTRTTDVLAQRHTELETKARVEAERGFQEAASASGILTVAERSVERTVRALVKSLGFESVEIEFREPSSAEAR